ncbi:MAG: sensor domain-containing diguanylate cyclase/phosphohydrolase [Saccharofermentanales bacterium]
MIKNLENPAKSSASLRQRAEEAAKSKLALSEENFNDISPERIKETFHELYVHQIELEMQNIELFRTQSDLEDAKTRYFDLYDLAPVGYCIISEKGLITDSNLTFSKMLGIERRSLINKRISQFVLEKDQDIYYTNRKSLFDDKSPLSWDLRMIRKDGTLFSAHMAASLSSGAEGMVEMRMIISDISDKKHAEDLLKESEECYKALFEYAGVAISYYDPDGNVIFLNNKASEILGGKPKAFVGKSVYDLYPGEKSVIYMRRIIKAIASEIPNEYEDLMTFNGIDKWNFSTYNRILDSNGNIAGVQVISQDVTQRKQEEKEILYLAYHDQLTGLYNRRYYEEALAKIDTKSNLPISLVMGDVNGLKLINDSFGHAVGDELLKKVADAISKGCRKDDVVARLGGDEFIIILPKTDLITAEKIFNNIKSNLVEEKVGAINISITFGCETKSQEQENIYEIYKNTEDHMYRHKLSESSSMRSKTSDIIMKTLYEKNHREMLHSKRVSIICENIAKKMNLSKDNINQLRIAGLMHDIGKIGIDEKILNDHQDLSNLEWNEVKRHTEIGYRILSSVNEYSEIADCVLEHHERWDGLGYPKGLKGENILLFARIIAIADAYDAMTSRRSYRSTISSEYAAQEIMRFAGKQFDPAIARIFVVDVLRKEWKEPES